MIVEFPAANQLVRRRGFACVYFTNKPHITPMCNGSYAAGKIEQGKIYCIWPGRQLVPTMRCMLERTVRDKGTLLPRTGETCPGFNMCKLRPFLVWMKPKDKKG